MQTTTAYSNIRQGQKKLLQANTGTENCLRSSLAALIFTPAVLTFSMCGCEKLQSKLEGQCKKW